MLTFSTPGPWSLALKLTECPKASTGKEDDQKKQAQRLGFYLQYHQLLDAQGLLCLVNCFPENSTAFLGI